MKNWVLFTLLAVTASLCSQTSPTNTSDTSYLEDQFYVGATYNFLTQKPTTVAQRNLSYGIQLGAIRDIPLNSTRTFGLGLGMGLSLNNYYSNLVATNTKGTPTYQLGEAIPEFQRSKLQQYSIDLPIEFRWRTSTPESYRFWRLYTGIKTSYLLSAQSKSVIDGKSTNFSNSDIRRLQYGITLNLGYNTFNLHMYYALNTLLGADATLANESVVLRPLHIGVIFYIL